MIINTRVLAVMTVVLAGAGLAGPEGVAFAATPAAAVTASVGQARAASAAAREFRLTVANQGPDTNFGAAIATSGDTVVIGASSAGANNGLVYVYIRPAAGWTAPIKPTAVLSAPEGAIANGDAFGSSVAIEGSTIVVGGDSWSNTVLGQGAVFVFTKPTGGWKSTSSPNATLTNANPALGDSLGASVAISDNTIVAGAYNRAPASTPGVHQGEAYVFARPPGGWHSMTETAGLTPAASNNGAKFGNSVAISGDTIVVGSAGRLSDTGSAYVFVKPTVGGWATTDETRELVGANNNGDYFGTSVGVAGKTVVVGEPGGGNVGQGDGLVFVEPSTGWGKVTDLPPSPTAVLTPNDGKPNDDFGTSIAISGTTVLVGADGHQVGTHAQQGSAYVYTEPAAGWKTTSSDTEFTAAGTIYQEVGQAVAVDADQIIAGAPSYGSGVGAAYLFARPGPALRTLKQAHKSWQLGTAKPSVNPKKKPTGGTDFSFSLNEAATVRLAFAEKVHGKQVSKGTLKLTGRSGKNTVYFAGKITGHKVLVPGHASVAVSVTNTYGTSPAKTLTFTVRAAKKKHH